jgi:spermidine/putrescine transport system permease protein
LGAFSIVLAHITFSVSYVIITVQARLQDFDRTLEEAALDLGATPWKTFWYVTFPLIWPGILSGALLAFTLSFDDFLITFFTAGVGSDTLPLKVYSMIKFGVTPEINALSTTMLLITFILVLSFSTRSHRKASVFHAKL